MKLSRWFPVTHWLWARRAVVAYVVLATALLGAAVYKAPELAYLCNDWLNREKAWRTERWELISIAGEKAKDCGYIRFGGKPEKANSCAFESLAARQPFYVGYDVQGKDSHLIVGLALDSSGQLYSALFDSQGGETLGLKPPERVVGQVYIKPCAHAPEVTPRGYLSCEWPKGW
ncbi:MAG TPA: hypothetical protein VD837_06345 [Terriglobales bacterium]|nr:hypothetical protein [Terriglobales bacterium]